MTAQVKEQLRENGQLNEYPRTVFKVVKLEKDIYNKEIYRPAIVYDQPPFRKLTYKPNTWYKVGNNIEYPPYAFYDEEKARTFLFQQSLGNFAVIYCVAYQWVWVQNYLGLGDTFCRKLKSFWDSLAPYTVSSLLSELEDKMISSFMVHGAPPNSIVMFEFETGDELYGNS